MSAERVVAEAMELCRIPAPTGDEGARAEAVVRSLRAAGLDPVVDDVGNVLARIGPDGPAAVIAAHLDTVFPAATRLDVRREGDTVHGPGIGDNAIALAALLHAARTTVADERATPVLFAATVGEEGNGDLRGIRALLDRESVRLVVALEGHGVDAIVTAGVGSARMRARFRGPGGHSWQDRGRPSAIHAMFEAGQRAVRAAAPAAVNVGIVRGGTSINTIAADAELEIDIRSLDDQVLELAAERVEIELRRRLDGIEVTIERIGRRPGGQIAPDHPLVRAAQRARAAAGMPRAVSESASTDANAAYARDIPAITVGITRGGGTHRVDEWIQTGPIEPSLTALEHLVTALDEIA